MSKALLRAADKGLALPTGLFNDAPPHSQVGASNPRGFAMRRNTVVIAGFLCAASLVGACARATGGSAKAIPDPASRDSAMSLRKDCKAGRGLSCVLLELWEGGTHAGDTDASATMANGIDSLARECARSDPASQACTEWVVARLIATGMSDSSDSDRTMTADLQKACDQGTVAACWVLAEVFLRAERGDNADDVLARSCDRGDVDSCAFLASALTKGSSAIRSDPARGSRLAELACNQGSAQSCALVGEQYRDGLGRAVDNGEAARWFARGCDQDNGFACVSLGVLRETVTGDGPPDYASIAVLHERACLAHEVRGCTELGRLLAGGFLGAKDERRALGLFRQACADEDQRACLFQGALLVTGSDVEHGRHEGMRLLSSACAAGQIQACELFNQWQLTNTQPTPAVPSCVVYPQPLDDGVCAHGDTAYSCGMATPHGTCSPSTLHPGMGLWCCNP